MWLLGVFVRRYIDFLILLIPTPLVSVLFYSSIPTFCLFFRIYMYTDSEIIISIGRPSFRKCSKCFYIRVSKYLPNAIFCNATINAQRANVIGSMNWHRPIHTTDVT